jgi:hypothetical protein
MKTSTLLIVAGVGVAGYFAYSWAKPYLFAVKNVGTVAGDIKGITGDIRSTTRDISSITHSIGGLFSGWGTSGDSRIPSDTHTQSSGVGGDSESGAWSSYYSSWGQSDDGP